MKTQSADATLMRLRRIEGQVRGLQRMVAAGDKCEDMLTQLMAVRSGLEQVSLLLMDVHIQECVLADADVDHESMRNLLQTLRIWARFGAPASQLPE
jgi:CsoR family transcriptional regulator, copper-sensing transcriptional repressor